MFAAITQSATSKQHHQQAAHHVVEFVSPADAMMEPGQVFRLIQDGHICLHIIVYLQAELLRACHFRDPVVTSKPHVAPIASSSLRSQFEGLPTLAKHALSEAASITASACACAHAPVRG